MRIYVAGGSSERFTVIPPILDALRAMGWEITCDWTRAEIYDRPAREAAALDADGVERADLLWFVVPLDKSEGASFEHGYARGLGKPTIASGPHVAAAGRIFPQLADFVFARHEDALAHLGRLIAYADQRIDTGAPGTTGTNGERC